MAGDFLARLAQDHCADVSTRNRGARRILCNRNWLPTYLKSERKLSIIGTGEYIGVIIVGSFIGYLVGAYLADRIGRRLNFILFAACSLITVLVYTQLPVNDAQMLALGFPLGFFASGIFSGVGAFLTENFRH